MSPSLPAARAVWICSLPVIATILSLLWYRKKRGSLKTDSGGAVEESKDDQTSVNCEEEEEENTVENNIVPVIEEISVLSVKDEETEVISCQKDVDNHQEPEQPQNKVELSEVNEQIVKKVVNTSLPESSPVPVEVIEEVVTKSRWEVDKAEKQQNQPEEVEDKPEDIVLIAEEENFVSRAPEPVAVIATTVVEEAKADGVVAVKTTEPSIGKRGKKSKKMAKKSDATAIEQRQQQQAKKEGSKKSNNNNNNNSTASILEKKLEELDLSSSQCNGDVDVGEKPLMSEEDVAERDSANNSPSEVMLASPSVSGYSDTHSEGSSDSGKGCSEMLTPSRTPASGNSVSGDLPATLVYEFEFPQYLIGRLIGKHGANVQEIKKATNASLYVKTHPNSEEFKICAVEGTQMDVDSALQMIRRKFPKKRYPDLTLEQVVIEHEPLMFPIFPENCQLYLVEGINNDVILSSLVSAGHFFLQQPTHPTFPALSRLNACMASCYSEPNQPNIPEGVGAGILCAAPMYNGWFRAQITEMEEGSEFCRVKFVDYGGYMTMPVSSLRQIRADFINLPFQAAECYLADVQPANGASTWSEEAKESIEELTLGNILQAQVYGYAFPGVPLIYLYTLVNNEFVLINEELVNRGYAEWQTSSSEP